MNYSKPFLSLLLLHAFLLVLTTSSIAQVPDQYEEIASPSISSTAEAGSNRRDATEPNAATPDTEGTTRSDWYVPPSNKKRVERLISSVIGPESLIKYGGTAALTTWRKTPSEWGSHWQGFGGRYANVMAKSAISSTTTFALDGALKVDSHFYPSRDRSPAARLRNAIFSPFTARDRQGKRVFGIPRIVGYAAAGTVSSETWYPKRFNYVHGLKGTAISVAFNVTFNIFREFVWKK